MLLHSNRQKKFDDNLRTVKTFPPLREKDTLNVDNLLDDIPHNQQAIRRIRSSADSYDIAHNEHFDALLITENATLDASPPYQKPSNFA
jgi:hypothetical protein